MNRALVSWLSRLIVSAAVVAVLLAVLPLEQLWSALGGVSAPRWSAVVALFMLGHVVTALKWRLLMGRRDDVPPPLWLRAHFSGLVANLCLPGVAGGDVVRAGTLMRRVARAEQVGVASVVDRMVDTLSLLLLAIGGLVWVGQPSGHAGSIVIGAGVLLGAGAALAAAGTVYLQKRSGNGIGSRVAGAVRMLVDQPWVPLVALVLSLAVQSLFIWLSAWLGDATGVRAPLAAWFVAWPLAKLAAMVPISLGGLGVREATLVAFMAPFGAEASAVMAAGLLWQGVLVASGLVGWIVMQAYPDTAAAAQRQLVI